MPAAVITGAAGFIGRNLVQELARNDYEVFAYDVAPMEVGQGDEPFHHTQVAVDEIETVRSDLEGISIDLFYHLAWRGVAGQVRSNVAVQMDNIRWVVEALHFAASMGAKRFISIGTIMEAETLAAVLAQGNRPGADYIYGGAKLMAHLLCMTEANRLGIDAIWTEITNTYGPGETSPRLVNTTLRKCLAGDSPQFTAGTQIYDFIYIDDVVRALRLAGEKGKPFCHYLIGSGHAKPLKEYLLEMQAAVAPNVPFLFGDVPFTGIDLPLSAFDCSKTEADLGFVAKVSFGEGCLRTATWLEDAFVRGD